MLLIELIIESTFQRQIFSFFLKFLHHLIFIFFLLFFFSDVLCISVAPMFLAAAAPPPVFTSDGPPGMGPESGVGVSTGVY